MNNILNVNFEEGKVIAKAGGLWQWDKGQKMRIFGTGIRENVEIHFSLMEKGGGSKKLIAAYDSGLDALIADIPNTFLANESLIDYKLYAFLYVRGEGTAETVYKIILTVKVRPKPEGYEDEGSNVGTESFKVTVTYDLTGAQSTVTADRSFAEIKNAIDAGKFVFVAFEKVQDVGGEPTVTETQYMPLIWCWDGQYIRFGFTVPGNDGYTLYFVDFWPEEEAIQYGVDPVDYGFMTSQFASKTAFDTLAQKAAEKFVVNITSTYNESTHEYEYSCDKTHTSILAAATAGKYVYAYFDRLQSVMPMVMCGPQIWFGYAQVSSVVAGKTMGCLYVVIASDETIFTNFESIVLAEKSDLDALEQRVTALEQAIANT